ncbi:unnamed protein product [Lactuca saligna]|uniref:Uncharacterized protein n=1 Tax=Lactuca saligna TaxID=75948 RepID=A0AA36E378_LACSI|nr:unnamed protein product [Lactuca saligna]
MSVAAPKHRRLSCDPKPSHHHRPICSCSRSSPPTHPAASAQSSTFFIFKLSEASIFVSRSSSYPYVDWASSFRFRALGRGQRSLVVVRTIADNTERKQGFLSLMRKQIKGPFASIRKTETYKDIIKSGSVRGEFRLQERYVLHLYMNMINKNNNSYLVFRARFSNLVGLLISLPVVRFVLTISEQVQKRITGLVLLYKNYKAISTLRVYMK